MVKSLSAMGSCMASCMPCAGYILVVGERRGHRLPLQVTSRLRDSFHK